MMAELMNMNKTIGMNNEHLNMYKTKLFVEEVTKRAASSATKPQLSEAPPEDGSLPIFLIFFPQLPPARCAGDNPGTDCAAEGTHVTNTRSVAPGVLCGIFSDFQTLRLL